MSRVCLRFRNIRISVSSPTYVIVTATCDPSDSVIAVTIFKVTVAITVIVLKNYVVIVTVN